MNDLFIQPDEGIRLSGKNRALYLRMLSRFPCDPSMDRLKAAFLRQDQQEAYLHAHTLKGLCAQLALPALESEAASLCLLLRSGEHMPLVLPQSLTSTHATTVKAILRFLQSA